MHTIGIELTAAVVVGGKIRSPKERFELSRPEADDLVRRGRAVYRDGVPAENPAKPPEPSGDGEVAGEPQAAVAHPKRPRRKRGAETVASAE